MQDWDARFLEYQPGHRLTVVRKAVLLTPFALMLTALLLWALTHLWGSILMVIILGIGAIAMNLEAVAALRDLAAKPVTTRGRIDRLWSKGRFLFFGKVHYMLIDRRLFEVGAIAAAELKPGDPVVVEHWPHTNVIITLERGSAEDAETEATEGRRDRGG